MSDYSNTSDSEEATPPPLSMADHYVYMVRQAYLAEKEAVEATARAKDLRTKIEAVKKVLTDSGFPLPEVEREYAPAIVKRRGGPPKRGAPTWVSEITSIVAKHKYIKYGELKDILAAGSMGPHLILSEKGFYGALRRLEKRNVIVRHKGYAFTLDAFRQYEDEVTRGLRSELVAAAKTKGGITISDKVLTLLDAQPIRLTANEISEELELNSIGTLYNVLKKLTDSGLIVRDTDSSTYWSPNHSPEPKTAVLVAPPSREGELPLDQPAVSAAR